MAAREKTNQPTNRTLRHASWVVAGAIALGGNLLGPSATALWLELAGAAVFAIGTVRPSALRPILQVLTMPLRAIGRLGAWFAKSNSERRPPSPTAPSRRGQVANSGV